MNISIHKMKAACTEIKCFCADSRGSKQQAETVFSYASVVILSSFTDNNKKQKSFGYHWFTIDLRVTNLQQHFNLLIVQKSHQKRDHCNWL